MGRKAYERGMKTRRKVLGDEWVDLAQRNMTPFNQEFQDLITRYAWDEIWNRPRLPHPVRRMLVMAICVTSGRWDEFKLHMRAALESGDLEQEDVKEVLLQCAVYAGVPSANHAFREAREVLESLAAKKKARRRK
jgi:4-carboxymuconolactone decarboxylase